MSVEDEESEGIEPVVLNCPVCGEKAIDARGQGKILGVEFHVTACPECEIEFAVEDEQEPPDGLPKAF